MISWLGFLFLFLFLFFFRFTFLIPFFLSVARLPLKRIFKNSIKDVSKESDVSSAKITS